MKFWICSILALAGAGRGFGCDFCAMYAAQQAEGIAGTGFFAGLAEQYTWFDTFQSGGQPAANPDGEYMHSLNSQVYAGYNFTDWLGVQLNLPVIYRAYGKTGVQASEAGIGDLSLAGNVRLWQHRTTDLTLTWTAMAGVKFPTGDPAQLNPALPEFAAGIGGHDLALGSGSYDGLFGTTLFGRFQRLFLSASMQYGLRSEGAFQYRFANDWSWSGGPGFYVWLQDSASCSVQAVVSGETKGQDTVAGVPMDDTAERIVYLGPRVNFTWAENWSLEAEGDLPVSIVSSGDMLVPNYRIRAALNCRF
ncbi:MAG: hypothetical protein U1F98_06745 [Verrucomicrobiota bacterium]